MKNSLRRFLLTTAICLFPLVAVAQSAQPPVTLTPAATIYAAGQCLGVGNPIFSINGTSLVGGLHGSILQNITVVDPTGQDSPIDFLVFATRPTGSYNDQSTCTLSTSVVSNQIDARALLGVVSVVAYKTYGTAGVAQVQNISLVINQLQNNGIQGVLYFIPVVQGTPTYGSNKSLYVSFGFIPN